MDDTVTQADREAAKKLAEYAGFTWSADHLDMAIDAAAEAFARHRIAHQPDSALADELRALANAEAEYRRSHDLFGTDDMRTGRAWDAMRRAGDKARAILTALGGHHEPSGEAE